MGQGLLEPQRERHHESDVRTKKIAMQLETSWTKRQMYPVGFSLLHRCLQVTT